jgi:hypothetical protein
MPQLTAKFAWFDCSERYHYAVAHLRLKFQGVTMISHVTDITTFNQRAMLGPGPLSSPLQAEVHQYSVPLRQIKLGLVSDKPPKYVH